MRELSIVAWRQNAIGAFNGALHFFECGQLGYSIVVGMLAKQPLLKDNICIDH